MTNWINYYCSCSNWFTILYSWADKQNVRLLEPSCKK